MREVGRNNLMPVRVLKAVGLACLLASVAAAPKPAAGQTASGKATKSRTALRGTPELLRPSTPKPAAKTKSAKPVRLTAFANRPATIEESRTIRMEVTAYCPCTKCCGPGAHGVTASGNRVTFNGGKFVAADTDVLPFGTRLLVPGYDAGVVEVIDRGSAIKGRRLDVFFPTHEQAMEWGRRTIDVIVVE